MRRNEDRSGKRERERLVKDGRDYTFDCLIDCVRSRT